MIALSHYQAKVLLQARRQGLGTVSVSLDLNRTHSEVCLEELGASFPDGQSLGWDALQEITENEATCYAIRDGQMEKIQYYSEAMGRLYSLLGTEGAPTMLVAGFPMHRIKGIDPREDTRRKIQAIAPVTGRVLDTTTGLGYTAIQAAQTALHVTTIEIDPTALKVARLNPWSQELFDHPKIEQRIGSAYDLVPTFRDESFSRIFHDPPTFKLAGDLYSGAFYGELYRVLQRGGRMFHYIGDLNSAHGCTVSKGAIKRLQAAGFQKVTPRPEAFGLSAIK